MTTSTCPWRIGRSVGRTIYAVLGGDPGDDLLIGLMDSPEIAKAAVDAHNERLRWFLEDCGRDRSEP